MIHKLKPHYKKLSPQRFVILTVLTLLVLDFINCYYLKLYWLKKGLSRLMVYQSVQMNELTVESLTPGTIRELIGLVDNAFYFFIILILVNNIFFYFFYLRKKLWAQGFVLFYTLSAAIFSLSFIFDNAGLGMGWMAYNFLTIIIYLYLYLGVKILKNETTVVINPGHEKKGR
jgi:hypothetical protein